MANTQNKCKLCLKRILGHHTTAKCTSCNFPWHAKCLPNFSDDDLTYARTPSNHWACPQCLSELFPFTDIENITSFNEAVNNPINLIIDIETLDTMIYDPFDTTDNERDGALSDIDPDQNYLREINGKAIADCKYYYTSTQMGTITEQNNNASISMLHLNIRSIPKNLDTFLATLHSSSLEVDLLTFSETWLKPANADCYGIQGYSHEYLTREN